MCGLMSKMFWTFDYVSCMSVMQSNLCLFAGFLATAFIRSCTNFEAAVLVSELTQIFFFYHKLLFNPKARLNLNLKNPSCFTTTICLSLDFDFVQYFNHFFFAQA